MTHHCHAKGCTTEVDPSKLMCFKHWKMVPRGVQRMVCKHYVSGQEIGKDPSPEYVRAALFAVRAVAEKEAELCL